MASLQKQVAACLGIAWAGVPGAAQTPVAPARVEQVQASAIGTRDENAANPIQQAGGASKRDLVELGGFLIQLVPPGPQRMFRFESEATLRERIRQEWRYIKKVEFPGTHETPAVTTPQPRTWPCLVANVEPAYVCYHRLWFEQRNSERYGWDCGILHPLLATGLFYTDVALLPLRGATLPYRCFDGSAGDPLPGDPVPFRWHPLLLK